ncbi:ABC transporter permease [Pseudoxanthomonas putridarboris]|uniref:ABC transporter permease n=1 Tax=Pseudoxanthomonas putridarboris TaxID=752605 RepID=A0ABU9IUV9_9GAMM
MTRHLVRDYLESFRHPEFWIYATWLDLVTKYRRSRLGMFWAFFPPVLYTFGVGSFFAHLQGIPAGKFVAHLGLGYMIFRFVTVSLSEATTTYAGHANFILDGRVRLTDYVLRVVAKALFYFMLAIPVMAVALAMSPDFRVVGLLALLPALALVFINVAWMGAVVSVIGARLQDVYELVGSALMFSFLFTPILWTAANAPPDTLRGGIARLNPLFHLVEIVRAPLLGEPIESWTYKYLVVFTLIGWLMAIHVYRRYARFVPLWV